MASAAPYSRGFAPTASCTWAITWVALQNWVDLQQDYDCIYCALDVHALTTVESRSDTEVIQSNIDDKVLDWLAAGIEEVYEEMGLAYLSRLAFVLPCPIGEKICEV